MPWPPDTLSLPFAAAQHAIWLLLNFSGLALKMQRCMHVQSAGSANQLEIYKASWEVLESSGSDKDRLLVLGRISPCFPRLIPLSSCIDSKAFHRQIFSLLVCESALCCLKFMFPVLVFCQQRRYYEAWFLVK